MRGRLSGPQRGALAVVSGLAALTVGVASSPRAPALYDGVGFPDEAYRYAQVLPGDPVKTKPPTSGTAMLALAGGSNVEGIQVSSSEQGPQVSIYVPAGAVHGGGSSATVSAAPEAPAEPAPADGPIAGNVYRVGISSGAWAAGQTGTIALRSPQGVTVAPLLEVRTGGAWRALSTSRVGTDIWQAPISGAGDYALVLAAPRPSSSHRSLTVPILAGGAGALVALILGIRLVRRRPDADADPDT